MIQHPESNKILPRMTGLIYLFENPNKEQIPYYRVEAKDCEVLGSELCINGSLDPIESWSDWLEKENGNGRSFTFLLRDFYQGCYKEGNPVYIVASFQHCKPDNVQRFPLCIGTPEECAAWMKGWINLCIVNQPQ